MRLKSKPSIHWRFFLVHINSIYLELNPSSSYLSKIPFVLPFNCMPRRANIADVSYCESSDVSLESLPFNVNQIILHFHLALLIMNTYLSLDPSSSSSTSSIACCKSAIRCSASRRSFFSDEISDCAFSYFCSMSLRFAM